MNKEDLTAKDFIGHMLEAAGRVLQYTKDLNREEFFASPLVQDAVVRNIEIIGEAANNLLEIGPDIAAKYPAIPFAQIADIRHEESRRARLFCRESLDDLGFRASGHSGTETADCDSARRDARGCLIGIGADAQWAMFCPMRL